MSADSTKPLRILLLGSHGLLGSEFLRQLAPRDCYLVHALGRGDLNLTNPASFERCLEDVEFDVLVNCAAYTAVDDSEIQGDLAYLVNGQAPGVLARIANRRGARMIHFSTDFVFDGEKGAPYTELDSPAPVSVYGRSKLQGETMIEEVGGDHLIVRLSWLFGRGRPAFPEWLLARARSQETVEIVGDKIACPTWSTSVVRDLEPWLRPGAISRGLLHYCNPPAVTWADYAQEILNIAAECKLPLLAREITPVPIAKVTGLSARRPPNSALDVGRFISLAGRSPCGWQEAIRVHLGAT